eukprot:gene13544-13671_t
MGGRFLIGEELGRGAYGQVFKGMDTTTGDVVAIKQISLGGVSQENLAGVMGEIDLLKTLNHKNIVKYIGSFKSRSHLYIILEFMENGALSSVIKPNRFGVFPESLVAIYITQGLVKLADFGVAAKLGELEDQHCDELHQNVAGSPYWMAPEVIEMTQVTPASDIWSVGCLIIELLTGYPPYYDLQPMSALFRIVQDGHPPLPDSVSPLLDDFLLQCFQKDPSARPDACSLLQHEWLQFNRRTLRGTWDRAQGFRSRAAGSKATEAHETVNSVVSRILQAESSEDELPLRVGALGADLGNPAAAGAEDAAAASLRTIDAASGPLASNTPVKLALQQDALRTASSNPSSSNTAFLGTAGTAHQQQVDPASPGAGAAGHPQLLTFVGQQLQYGPPSNVTTAAVAGGRQHPSSRPGFPSAAEVESPLSMLLARIQGDHHAAVGTPSAASGAAQAAAGQSLMLWLDDGPPTAIAGRNPNSFSSLAAGPSRGQLLEGGMPGSAGQGGTSLLNVPSGVSLDGISMQSMQVGLDNGESSLQIESKRKVRDLVRSLRPGARDANMTPQQAAQSLASMFHKQTDARQQFLSEGGVLAALELLDADQARLADAALDLLLTFTAADTRLLESLCLVGLVPVVIRLAAGPTAAAAAAGGCFAAGGVSSSVAALPGGQLGAGSTAAKASIDASAGGAAAAYGFGAALPAGSLVELTRLRSKAAGFVAQLCFAKETTLQMFIACGGLSDDLEYSFALGRCGVLETYGALPINYICRIFAHGGLVPRLYAVIKQLISLGRQQQRGAGGSSYGAGAATAAKLHHLHSPSSPSVFSQALTSLGLEGGEGGDGSNAGSSTPRSAVTAAAGGLLARGGHKSNSKESGLAGVFWLLGRLVFLAGARGNSSERTLMGDSRDNLQQLLDLIQRLAPPGLLKVMKTIRWLTSDPSVLPAVKDSGAISQLVPFLSREREAMVGQAVVLEALQALYNICKFNKRVHLEVAATAGIVPHLCRFASEAVAAAAAAQQGMAPNSSSVLSPVAGDPLAEPAALSAAAAQEARRAAVRTFVVPLLIGMASTSSSTRAKLWASNGLDIFLQLLGTEDSQMQVGLMRTLDIWLAEDHSRVENRLCQREAVGQLIEVYIRLCRGATARSPVMPQMLDSLKVMLGRSSKVAVALAAGGLVPPLLEPLSAGLTSGAAAAGGGGSAPILRAKLLEIVRIMYQHYPRPKEFIMKYRIQDVLLRLLESEGRGEDAVKVEAQKLLNAFHINVLL